MLDGKEIANFVKELTAIGFKWFKPLLSKLGININNEKEPLQYNYAKLNAHINQNLNSNLATVRGNKDLFKLTWNEKNLAQCDKRIVNTAVAIGKIAKKHGYTLLISDGFRSGETQAASYNSGKAGVAAPGKSAHEAGLALDIWLITPNGKQISIEDAPAALKKEATNYFNSNNIEWGGNWKDPYEPWHINVKNWRQYAKPYCK